MNFTAAGVDGRDDVHVLLLEYLDGWLYELRIDNHPIYGEHPCRSLKRYFSQDDTLSAAREKAKDLCGPKMDIV